MAFTAADVGQRIDLLLDGQGYVFADIEHDKALYGYTPTFVPRQNIQGNYGDNQQDSWLTWTQKDWSGGEGVRYQARGTDPQNTFWRGKGVNIGTPGQVTSRIDLNSITTAANPKTVAAAISTNLIYFATSTNLYHVNLAGTITGDGAHGLGAAPSRWGMCTDPIARFLSTTAGGSVGVRREAGGVFTTFSATTADSLAYLNNALYGYAEPTGSLIQYSTAGVATTIFTWRAASGTAVTTPSKLVPFGGKLLILRYLGSGDTGGGELWLYDGTAPAKIAEFPHNFTPYDIAVINGAVFISGVYTVDNGVYRAAILFYRDGTQGELWRADHDIATQYTPSLASFNNGCLFNDGGGYDLVTTSRLVYYDAETGAFSTIAENAGLGAASSLISTAASFALIVPSSSSGTSSYTWPGLPAASGTVDSSIIDFDVSLGKQIRGVRVNFLSGGGTSSVDIDYSLDEAAFTSLRTNAVSGVEYLMPVVPEGTTYSNIQIRITLNIGTGVSPKLKRVAVRGMPILPSYKKRTYVLLLGGRDGESPVKLRDNTLHPKDGKDMATDLQTAVSRTSPFTIVDSLGSFTGRVGEDGLQMVEYKPQQWIAKVSVREV